MKKMILAAALTLMTAQVFAGPQEREIKAEGEANVKTAVAAIKGKCSCAPTFDVKWDSCKTADELRTLKGHIQDIGEKGSEYCKDAPTKAAICKAKKIALSCGPEAKMDFKNGTASFIYTHDSGFPMDRMISEHLDK